MNDRHEEMAQATTKGRQLAIQWWQDRLVISQDFEGLIKSIDSALSRIEAETEARVLEMAIDIARREALVSQSAYFVWKKLCALSTKNLPTFPTANEKLSSAKLADGWKLVPVVPTEEIIKAMEWQIGGTPGNPVKTWGTTKAIYDAAIQAAEKGE